jgi:hypothetical protein
MYGKLQGFAKDKLSPAKMKNDYFTAMGAS